MICDFCKLETKDGYLALDRNSFCRLRCAIAFNKLKDSQINWDLVEEQIQINKLPRINWKAILGMSLTRAIARYKTAGMSAAHTYASICFEHEELTAEMKRRLRIGIAARFGETDTYASELKRSK